MKTISFILAGAAVATALTGCKSNNQYVATNTVGEVKTESLNQTDGVIQHVLFGEWIATQVGDQAVSGDKRPFVIFSKDATNPYIVKYYANNGCNIINGQFAVTPGGKMESASEAASTMMMCHDAPYEVGTTMALSTVRSYTMEKIGSDYLMYLKDGNGVTTMILRKYESGFINGAWEVTEISGTKVSQDKNIRFVIDLPEHKIHGNAGCNIFNGSVSSDPDVQNSLRINDVITTRMTCPDINLEQKFLTALAGVSNATQGNDRDSVTLLDGSGQTIMKLTRIDPSEIDE